MKRSHAILIVLMIVLVGLAAVVGAVGTEKYWRIQQSNYMFQGDVATSAGSELYLTAADVALTTPTATFSAVGKSYINLSTNGNLTGARPIDGVEGQVLIIRAANGAGTNTIRFDDLATTLSLGGNVTLTEGNNSTLMLLCTSGAYSSRWCLIGGGQAN